jgi:hypothetical protein
LSFLPLTYSPYYAGALFKVEPLPMRVGQPVHLRVPLKNYKKEAYALHVRASANPPNIGMLKWTDVGRTETFVLQPGESREVTITWTPTVAAGKLCLKVEVWGNAARAEAAAPFSVFRAAFVQQPVPGPASPFPGLSGIPLDIRQHNFFDGVTCSIPERKPEAAPSPEGNPVPTTSSGSIVVVEGRVEIRQSPNASAPLVGKAMDRSLTYTQVVRQDGEVTWYYVTPPSASRSGWISAKDVVKDNPDGPPKKPTDSPRLGGPATKGDCGGCVPPSGQELALLENEWDRRQAEAKPLKGDLEQLLKVFQEMQSLLLGYREAIALCALYDISKEILSAASGNLGEIADILEKLIDGDLTLLTKLLGSDEVSTLVDLYGGAFPEGFDWSGNARAKIESCTILPDGDRARALSFLDKREEVRQRMRALQEKVNNVRSRDHELIGKWLKYLDACHAWAACAKLPASSCAQPPAGLNVPGR